MKMIIALLFLATQAGAQIATTQDEYNYLTKGYKVQLESGLDMKKGYVFGDSFIGNNGGKTFTLTPLIREERKEVCAVLLQYKIKSVWGETLNYLCIPINNPALEEQFNKDVERLFYQDVGQTFAKSIAPLLVNYFSQQQTP